MLSSLYEVLALGARALFLVLGCLVVLRGALYLLREHHTRKKILRSLPDAGMVGEMRDVDSDKAYPLPREGVLGGSHSCDIRLKGLRRRQVNFTFVEGKGVLLTPCTRRHDVLLNGDPLGRGAYALHGAMLRAGGYTLRIRLFAGLNVPHPATFQEMRQPVFEEELYGPDFGAYNDPNLSPAPFVPAYSQQEEPLFYSQRMPVMPQSYAPVPEPYPQPETYAPQSEPAPAYEPEYELPYAYDVPSDTPFADAQPVYPCADDLQQENNDPPLFDAPFAPAQGSDPAVPYQRRRRSDRRRTL